MNKSAFLQTLAGRNKNLGNIRSGSDWLGCIGSYHGFCVFDTWAHGIRALVKLLRTYMRRGWLVNSFVFANHYAPSGDGNNNPQLYAKFVDPAWRLCDDNEKLYHTLAYYVIWMETGIFPDELSASLFGDANKIYSYIRLS